jgi:hypothetical protein
MQVRDVDQVIVEEPECPDARTCERDRGRAT